MFHKTCHVVVAALRGKCKDLELQLKQAQEAMRIEKITRRAMLNDFASANGNGGNDHWWGAVKGRWGGGGHGGSVMPWWNPHLTREEILELPPYPPEPHTVRTSWGANIRAPYGWGGTPGNQTPIPHGKQLGVGMKSGGDLGWASTCDGKGVYERVTGPTFGVPL